MTKDIFIAFVCRVVAQRKTYYETSYLKSQPTGVWCPLFLGIGRTEFSQVFVYGFEDFGIFFEIFVNSLVFFSEGEYNFERLGFIVVLAEEAGQDVMKFLAHGCRLEFVRIVINKNDTNALLIVYTEIR